MRTLAASHAPHERSDAGPGGLVLTQSVGDGTAGDRLQWAARSTSHAVTCDYLVGRGRRVCSCRASRVAVR